MEAFALVNLHKITDPKALVKKEEEAEPMEDSVSDDMEVVKKEPTTTEAAAVEVTEEDVARYLELFMSHCVRKPSLLNEYLFIFLGLAIKKVFQVWYHVRGIPRKRPAVHAISGMYLFLNV